MIIRSDEQWTTIECKNLKKDDGTLCGLCFKVLNGKFALIQQCPYCLGKIDLYDWAAAEEKKERLRRSKAVEDAGTLLWKES